MNIAFRVIFFGLALLPILCMGEPGEKIELDTSAAQVALIRYMETNPDCFAGFTPHLLKDAAKKVTISPDGRTAFIGRIQVDLVNYGYKYEHFSEDSKKGVGMNLLWEGKLEPETNGQVTVSAPRLTQEKWVRK